MRQRGPTQSLQSCEERNPRWRLSLPSIPRCTGGRRLFHTLLSTLNNTLTHKRTHATHCDVTTSRRTRKYLHACCTVS